MIFFKKHIFTFVGILYFIYFYYFDTDITAYFKESFEKGDIYFSFFNGFFAFLITMSLFNLVEDILEKVLFSWLNYMNLNQKKLNTLISKFIKRFFRLIQLSLGIAIFIFFIKKDSLIEATTEKVKLVIIVVLISYFIGGVIRILLEKQFQKSSKQKSSHASVIKFMTRVIVIIVWGSGGVFLLNGFGYDVTALVAGAGIGGLALALAAQKSLTNIFGAITIIANKPFQIGDYVNINGQEGTVKDIGLSYLTITDRLGHQVMMPNENIITSSIANFSVRENRRVDFTIGVIYDTTLDKMKQGVDLIYKILEKHSTEGSISDDTRVNFETFNAFSLDINVTYFSLVGPLKDFIKLKEEINLEIKESFTDAGIEMAFPTQEMIIKDTSTPFAQEKTPSKKA